MAQSDAERHETGLGVATRAVRAGQTTDPATGARVGKPLRGHTGRVRALSAVTLPGGQVLLASGSNDGTVRLWDPATGTQVGEPEPLGDRVGRATRDELHDLHAHRQPALNPHAHRVTRREAARVGEHVDETIQMGEYAGDRRQPNQYLEKAKDDRQFAPPAGHADKPNRPDGDIANPRTEDQQWQPRAHIR